MKKSSRLLESNQEGIHPNLSKILATNKLKKFSKPFSSHSLSAMAEIESWIEKQGSEKEILLDLCCGVGESTFHLATEFPEKLVLGIDKSADRIQRNNSFKHNPPINMIILRADLIDISRLLANKKDCYNFSKQYMYYPNPYPKKSQIKKRWYAHSVFPYLLELNIELEVRSNWKGYLEELVIAAEFFGYQVSRKLEPFIPEKLITPFERKYFESGHILFEVAVSPLLK
ncbi:MAG: SAM-dependent methyltransferase [Halobacteriovoraceae bacterium]|jgi:tRNA (guanine-N7-)-methyltransferase|nr:SAM-dependent methyltransferase [Halobacteriovoraceae bacterium]